MRPRWAHLRWTAAAGGAWLGALCPFGRDWLDISHACPTSKSLVAQQFFSFHILLFALAVCHGLALVVFLSTCAVNTYLANWVEAVQSMARAVASVDSTRLSRSQECYESG